MPRLIVWKSKQTWPEPEPRTGQIFFLRMGWTKLGSYGEFADMTLPEIVFRDSSYFFDLCERYEFTGQIGLEAKEVYEKAKTILPPEEYGLGIKVVYYYDPEQRFVKMRLEEGARSSEGKRGVRVVSNYIDLSAACRFIPQKSTDQLLIDDFKKIRFGTTSYKLTRKRCEQFFSDPRHFAFKSPIPHPDGWVG